ncbi:restriction endonuclease subunit S [Chryseobacterium sp.]|uniref:restriction endonuclease subunit S n=1 Tax=Chryseobacterium sp. TaxID=1871047 RepID=UPI002FC6320E
MQRYEKYKDSGVDWIGQIPEHWKILPGLSFIYENKAKNKGMIRNTVLSLSYGKIRVKAESELTGLVPESFETYQLVNVGDVIFRPTDLQNDMVSLRSSISEFEGIITSAYLNLRFKENADPKFFHYFFRSIDNNKIIYGLGSGLRQNISYLDFRRFNFPFPPLEEQQTIAIFLDDKTTKIDQTIAIKQKEIELLKERRQILIQKAVTKGLDDNVKMKDSGVDWIGEIPEHWEVRKLRFDFNLSKGLTITKENLTDEGVFCLNYGEIHSKYGFEVNPKIHKLRCVPNEYLNTNSNSILNNGDFIFADTSEDLEGSGNFTYLNSRETVFAGYHTVIVRPKNGIESRFFAYEFDSLNFRNQIRTKMKGVKVFSITQSILKDLTIWIPPYQEQIGIKEYLDEKTSKIDQIISLKQQEIEKLKEYKTVLIDNVVTGKVKVI